LSHFAKCSKWQQCVSLKQHTKKVPKGRHDGAYRPSVHDFFISLRNMCGTVLTRDSLFYSRAVFSSPWIRVLCIGL